MSRYPPCGPAAQGVDVAEAFVGYDGVAVAAGDSAR